MVNLECHTGGSFFWGVLSVDLWKIFKKMVNASAREGR